MPARITVEKEIILWAIRVSSRTIEEAQAKYPKFDDWLDGSTAPTFKQLKDFSNFTRIPFGYFMLKEPPQEEIDLLEFRTIDSEYIAQPTRELIDTINEMKYRQEWMREYLIQQNFPKNSLVGTLKRDNEDSVVETAHFILEQLNLPVDWKKKGKRNLYNFLKNMISNHGILVMQNGVVKNNNHRKLNINEFRAFTMMDDYAPLIFINNNDTLNGKTFSLLHELVHVFMGQASFYNENISLRKNKYENENEVFSNAVAAEILLPQNEFMTEWQALSEDSVMDKIEKISEQQLVSMTVVARKALDHQLISQKEYIEAVNRNLYYAEKTRENNQGKGGGNFHNTQISRIDNHFIYALSNGLDVGLANFTDIYKLTGLSRKNYHQIEQKLITKE